MSTDNEAIDMQIQADTHVAESATTQVSSGLLDNLSEDLRNEPSLQSFKDVNDIAKSYVHSQRMLGNSIRIPSKEAGADQMNEFYQKLQNVPGVVKLPEEGNDEQLASFYNKLGRPETPDGYDVMNAVQGLQVNEEAAKEFSNFAHKANLTKDQAQQTMAYYASLVEQDQAMQNQIIDQEVEQAQNVLQRKWGEQFDERLASAKSALRHYANEFGADIDQIINGPMGRDATFIGIMSDIGRSLQEKGSIQGAHARSNIPTPEEAQSTINDVLANKEHPYWNPSDPRHKEASAKVTNLYEIVAKATGGKKF